MSHAKELDARISTSGAVIWGAKQWQALYPVVTGYIDGLMKNGGAYDQGVMARIVMDAQEQLIEPQLRRPASSIYSCCAPGVLNSIPKMCRDYGRPDVKIKKGNDPLPEELVRQLPPVRLESSKLSYTPEQVMNLMHWYGFDCRTKALRQVSDITKQMHDIEFTKAVIG